jgi:hypothetical protein
MGIAQCDKHGRQNNAWVCDHVYPAMKSGSPLKIELWREFLWNIWACEECVRTRRLPLLETMAEEELDDDLFGPTCVACFNEWRPSTQSAASALP